MSNKQLLGDIARSGLTDRDRRKLHYTLLSEDQTKDLTNGRYTALSYKIPYYTPAGEPTPFYRLRFLEQPKVSAKGKATNGRRGFAQTATVDKTLRYWQPAKAVPRLYFPPNIQWKKVLSDTSTPLYITEGEKKAAKACKHGFYCIGLGGVWNWKSKKRNLPLLKDFDLITFEGRTVVLVFDSDSLSNVHVMQALNALSKQLTNKGAQVQVIDLDAYAAEHMEEPSDPDQPTAQAKLGLDDFLVQYGLEAFTELPLEPYPEAEELWRLNEELCFIEELNCTYNINNAVMIRTKQQLVGMYYANRTFPMWDGDKMKHVNAAEQWLQWRYRRTHKRLVYAPGSPLILGDNSLNLWRGWGTEPVKGDVKPFLELLKFLFTGAEPGTMQWFLQWLAYPIQYPGAKLYTAALLYGAAQGTGKSFVGYIMGDIYGENFNVVTQDELHDAYNDWVVQKQFLLCEEITGTDKRRDADRIKNMITREQLRVSIKYQPGYILKDCANSLFTSNHPDSFFLENSDRRVFVHEVTQPPASLKFYKRIDAWRKAGGAAHLMYYLLNNVSLKGFVPTAPAPFTTAKADMIALSKSDLDLFASALTEDPDIVLRMGGTVIDRELFTIDEVMAFIPDDGRITKPARIAVSKALRRAGFRCYTTSTDHGTVKLWPLRRPQYWAAATHGQRAQAYSASAPVGPHYQGAAGAKAAGGRVASLAAHRGRRKRQ